MKFTAVGDCFINRKIPSISQEFEEVFRLINLGEAKVANFEMTTAGKEAFPSAFSGGSWAKASPEVLTDLKSYGFNLINWANNHTLDYLHQGLLDTQRDLDRYGFVHAGAGQNLAEASAPRYLECESGRVALIGAVSTFHELGAAGEQRHDAQGRPGVNPLRYKTVYYVLPENLHRLKEIAGNIDINAKKELAGQESFSRDGVLHFGNYTFKEGKEEKADTIPLEKDMKRIAKSIKEAKRQADFVLVSIHAHEIQGKQNEVPANFLTVFARKCIDHGAHAVIGHGPHILRGIEIYKNRPIFYSLGNFIFQNQTIFDQPADYYEKWGFDGNLNVADVLDERGKSGLAADPLVFESVIAYWSMGKDGLKELLLYPVDLGFDLPRYQRGWPVRSKTPKALERLKELSIPFGTEISIDGLIGRVILE